MAKDYRNSVDEREPKIKNKKAKIRKKLNQGVKNIPSSLQEIDDEDFDWLYDLED